MDSKRERILRQYSVSPDARLSSGMEAEVYAYGPDTVLKLYPGTATLAELLTLQGFYDSIDRRLVPYALPRIYEVAQENPFLVTIEQRLSGTQMSAILPTLATEQLDVAMQRYLTAALALSQIQAPPAFDRYKLFDPNGISRRDNGDWHHFLSHYLTHKLAQVRHHLNRDVPQFVAKLEQLYAILGQPYPGGYRLIHGDFFPGNLLVDDNHQITGLLDFGLFTMYGDYLLDMATSWVFFDMYDELKVNARDRYLALLLDTLGQAIRGKLYRYVLIYSILSANTYSLDCTDGHYCWCVDNLCNQHYWDAVE